MYEGECISACACECISMRMHFCVHDCARFIEYVTVSRGVSVSG